MIHFSSIGGRGHRGSPGISGDQLGHLLVELGVGPGQPVAILLPNGQDYVVADQAIARIGAARVALTEMLSAKEVSHCLTDCGATVAIAGPGMIDAGAASGSEALHTIITIGGPSLPSAPPDCRSPRWTTPSPPRGEPCLAKIGPGSAVNPVSYPDLGPVGRWAGKTLPRECFPTNGGRTPP